VTKDDGVTYLPIGKAMGKEDMRRQIIEYAYRELLGWTKRYEAYKELAREIMAIKKILPK
jgi:hypothetical protein